MKKTCVMLTAFLMPFSINVSAADSEVRFLSEKPSDCRDVGQIVGVIDERIKDKWGIMDIGYAEPNSDFLQEMKTQARRMGGNRIVINNLKTEYVKTSTTAGVTVSYDFKNGTYIARSYYCR